MHYYYYGLPRQDKGTGVVSEDTLRNLIIDKLKSAGDIGFDRVHRLSSKPPPVISRCAFFEDKVKIVKAKRKRERERLHYPFRWCSICLYPNISNNMNSLIFKAVEDFITQSGRFAME